VRVARQDVNCKKEVIKCNAKEMIINRRFGPLLWVYIFMKDHSRCAGLPRFLDASQIDIWAKKSLRTTKLRSFSLLEGVFPF